MPDSGRPEILIVDDEELICFVLTHLLKVHGYEARAATRGDDALRMIVERRPTLVIMDIRMPGLSGFDVLARIRELDPHLPVILMTALSSVRDAVDAIKAGAFDYVAKPFNNQDLIDTVERALRAAAEGQTLRAAADAASAAQQDPPHAEEELPAVFAAMGGSRAVRRLAREAMRHAAGDAPVLILGEIGSGKRLLARTLHAVGGRRGEFLDIDCTGADEVLLRQELYGAAAPVGRRGKLELAREGTLLLDEIADFPRTLQDMLAEQLRAREFHRPGGSDAVPITARLLFASTTTTERRFVDEALGARFRALYGDAVLVVPPLRDRREDIPALVEEFLRAANAELAREVTGISDAALDMLVAYHWPGNVHQLRSTMRRAVLTAKDSIGADDIELPLPRMNAVHIPHAAPGITVAGVSLRDQVKRRITEVERQVVFETLRKTGWNKARASRMLGVTYKTLLKKVSEYGLERE
jgi:DNA-binding NtrC family response regulator